MKTRERHYEAACQTSLATALTSATLARPAGAQTVAVPAAITTPNKVDSHLGMLEFKDGAPNAAAVAKIYDNLDYTLAFNAFNNTVRGVSIAALRKGFLSIGVKDNEVIIFSELMDSKSLFLTANADTVYYFGGLPDRL